MGHQAFSKVQIGRESTAGTAVAATTIWRGPFSGLQDARETIIVPENIGIALPSSRSYAASLMAEWSQGATEFTPEQSLHIFEAGIKAATPTADGDSSGYLHRYAFPTTSANTIKTYSIQAGDETQAELTDYGFVKSFTITGSTQNALMVSAVWAGRTVANGTFTSSLTPETVSHIHASNGSLFIDDNDSSFGTTAISDGLLMEFTLTVNTGQKALFTIDSGQLTYTEVYFDSNEFSVELELKYLINSDSIAEREHWRANDQRLVRLEFTGDDYETAGSTGEFTTNALRIDLPAAYTSFSAVEFEQGKSMVTATLQGGYDTVSGNVFEIWVANEKSSL